MKVAMYARFGNKVESKLTEQEQKEAMQRIAEEMHHIQPRSEPMPSLEELKAKEGEVMTLPKKKAWIFIRYSVPIQDEMRERLSKDSRKIAEEHGYDVKGETVFIGSLPQAIDELKGFMKMNPPMYGADAVVLPVEDKILRVYDQAKELYDEMKSKGIVLLLGDHWEEVFDPTTSTALSRKTAYEKSKKLLDFLEDPQEELSEKSGPTMGGM